MTPNERTRSDASARCQVRPAEAGDAPAITRLSAQLGYPSDGRETRARLEAIAAREDAAVFVAQDASGTVAGWIHAYVVDLVESTRYVEIGGLVVDEVLRGRGIGRLLMTTAESWALARGIREIALRTNVVRERAHRFYIDLGYRVVKTQHRMRRRLDSTSALGGVPPPPDGDSSQNRP